MSDTPISIESLVFTDGNRSPFVRIFTKQITPIIANLHQSKLMSNDEWDKRRSLFGRYKADTLEEKYEERGKEFFMGLAKSLRALNLNPSIADSNELGEIETLFVSIVATNSLDETQRQELIEIIMKAAAKIYADLPYANFYGKLYTEERNSQDFLARLHKEANNIALRASEDVVLDELREQRILEMQRVQANSDIERYYLNFPELRTIPFAPGVESTTFFIKVFDILNLLAYKFAQKSPTQDELLEASQEMLQELGNNLYNVLNQEQFEVTPEYVGLVTTLKTNIDLPSMSNEQLTNLLWMLLDITQGKIATRSVRSANRSYLDTFYNKYVSLSEEQQRILLEQIARKIYRSFVSRGFGVTETEAEVTQTGSPEEELARILNYDNVRLKDTIQDLSIGHNIGGSFDLLAYFLVREGTFAPTSEQDIVPAAIRFGIYIMDLLKDGEQVGAEFAHLATAARKNYLNLASTYSLNDDPEGMDALLSAVLHTAINNFIYNSVGWFEIDTVHAIEIYKPRVLAALNKTPEVIEVKDDEIEG